MASKPINTNSRLAIGIDLGGTKIRGVLINNNGRILKQYTRPTQAHKPRKRIVNNILDVIKKLETKRVKGIGVGSPGFSMPSGRLTNTPNIRQLKNYNLKKELEKRTGKTVFLENDANCFALAEHRFGAAKNCTNSIGIIIGTGVGSGIIINNQLYKGCTGGAAEAGHTNLVINNQVKSVEDLISGPNIIKRYEELSRKKAYTPRVILNKKDKAARKVYEETVFYTGLFFANLIQCFSPEVIVVGGGVSNLPFYPDVRKVVKKYAHPFMAKKCKIKKHELGDDSGVIGAASLVFDDIR